MREKPALCTLTSEPLLLLSQANELLQSSRQIQNKAEKERTLKESMRLYQQISNHTDLPLVCSQYRQGECTFIKLMCFL